MRRSLALVTVSTLALSTACSHSVVIDSEPSGAEIRVNGEKLGNGPVTYSETTGWEKVYDIEANKAGYKATRKQLKQAEWNIPVTASVGVCSLLLGTPFSVVGALPLVGLFWARQLPDRVVVVLEKGGSGAPATDGGTPPSSYGY